MIARIRWFLYGVAFSVLAMVLVIRRMRQLRVRLDAEGLRSIAGSYAADAVELAGRSLQRSVPPPTETPNG